jgi:RNA polymerase sigma-70 factor (ECF subfamily)
MTQRDDREIFEARILPHLDAAYNYARWMVRNDAAAQDIVQESCLSAFKGIGGFSGGNARAWLLAIVRNECYDWLRKAPDGRREVDIGDEESLSAADRRALGHEDTPELAVSRLQDGKLLENALAALPAGYREVLVLKEQEDMSYREIAATTGLPLGTVMSRLSRARGLLREALRPESAEVAEKAREAKIVREGHGKKR